MAYFICEKQGRCCPHEFYDSIEQAITDSEDGVPCDHLIEVAPVRHARWDENGRCSNCGGHAPFWCMASTYYKSPWCQECGAEMDLEG